MTPFQLLALSTPAVIGAALLTLAYWVRTQNRAPILSENIAEARSPEWAFPNEKKTETFEPPPPSDLFSTSAEPSYLASRLVFLCHSLSDSEAYRERIAAILARADDTKPGGDWGSIMDPSGLAEIAKLTNSTIAGAEKNIADAEKALADLQKLFSTARIASGMFRRE
jgi:hypothetical protein